MYYMVDAYINIHKQKKTRNKKLQWYNASHSYIALIMEQNAPTAVTLLQQILTGVIHWAGCHMAINYLLLFVGRWIHRLPWVVRNCTFHLAVVYSSPVWVTQSGVALSHNLVLDLVLVLKSSLKNNFKQGRLSLTAVMQRAYFPAKQRGKFCPQFPYFLFPRGFPWHIFASPEVPLDASDLKSLCLSGRLGSWKSHYFVYI